MIKLVVGSFFGFIAGMTYGIYQIVDVENSLAVKAVKFLKIVLEGL